MPRHLQNVRSQLVGWRRESNGIELDHNHQDKLLGWYHRKTNHTHDSMGRLRVMMGDWPTTDDPSYVTRARSGFSYTTEQTTAAPLSQGPNSMVSSL